MLCVALQIAANSHIRSNAVINYAVMVRLFQTDLHTGLKNVSGNSSI